MKVDRDVIGVASQPPAQRHVRPKSAETAASRCNDDQVETGIVFDDRRGGWLDDVGQVRVWKLLAKGAESRRRKDDVTDLAKPDEKNLQSIFTVQWLLHR